jgi:2-methylisocitrate lyase-like PEP mutase family enzyme
MASQKQKAEIFKALHHSPTGFLMPNAWDPGSAIVLAQEGFPCPGHHQCRHRVLTRQV